MNLTQGRTTAQQRLEPHARLCTVQPKGLSADSSIPAVKPKKRTRTTHKTWGVPTSKPEVNGCNVFRAVGQKEPDAVNVASKTVFPQIQAASQPAAKHRKLTAVHINGLIASRPMPVPSRTPNKISEASGSASSSRDNGGGDCP